MARPAGPRDFRRRTTAPGAHPTSGCSLPQSHSPVQIWDHRANDAASNGACWQKSENAYLQKSANRSSHSIKTSRCSGTRALALGSQLNEEAAEFIKTRLLYKLHATLAIKVAGEGGADGSGLAKLAVLELKPLLGSKYNPEGARGNLLLGRVEKLHSLEEMVLSRLILEGEDEIKTIGIVLPWLTVDCQDAHFCHTLVYLGGILFCQVLSLNTISP